MLRTIDLSLRNVAQGYLDSIDALSGAVLDKYGFTLSSEQQEARDELEGIWLEMHTELHNTEAIEDGDDLLRRAEAIAEKVKIWGFTSEGWYYVTGNYDDVTYEANNEGE